jgi:hypothetical protein
MTDNAVIKFRLTSATEATPMTLWYVKSVSLRQGTKVVNRNRCHKALEKVDGSRRRYDKSFHLDQNLLLYLDLIQTECMLPVI